MTRRLWVLAIAIALLGLSQLGSAYSLSGERWASTVSTVPMQLQLGSAPAALIDGAASWDASATDALATWNPFLNRLAFQVTSSSSNVVLRNGVNNVAFSDTVYGDSFGDGLAVTISLFRSDRTLTETDVLFNRALSWNSYRGNQRRTSSGATLYDLHRVALHEFGHVLGLDHPDQAGQSVTAIMNSRVSNIDSLQADDTNGVAAIYGAVPASDILRTSGRLTPGQSLVSSNRRYRLVYQSDGNLVLYDMTTETAPWASNRGASTAGQVVVQTDGNFVVYNGVGAAAFATRTQGANAILAVQNDGNVVLYAGDGRVLWARLQ